jgi:hypothetical protein
MQEKNLKTEKSKADVVPHDGIATDDAPLIMTKKITD